MRCDLMLIFTPRQTLDFSVEVEQTPALAAQAREWFDQTWTALGCEPLRPSGKVLLLDKIMGVADALGYAVLASDRSRADEYVRQTALALGKPRITVDLPGLTVGY